MEFPIFIEKGIGMGLIAGIVIFFSYPQASRAQSQEKVIQTTLNKRTYISAFTPIIQGKDTICYTIQICTMNYAVNDQILQGNSKIKAVRMGDVYRYIFSQYELLSKAREDLVRVRKVYPKAFIREYRHGQLGLAVDMNIDQLRINH